MNELPSESVADRPSRSRSMLALLVVHTGLAMFLLMNVLVTMRFLSAQGPMLGISAADILLFKQPALALPLWSAAASFPLLVLGIVQWLRSGARRARLLIPIAGILATLTSFIPYILFMFFGPGSFHA
jgi:hypothetical protein